MCYGMCKYEDKEGECLNPKVYPREPDASCNDTTFYYVEEVYNEDDTSLDVSDD